MPDPVEDAAREVYSVAPEEFLARRGELAKQARSAGDADAARAIEKLRKPTVAAWLVNSLVLDDASVIERLTDLGDRLRRAQHALDAAQLRDLSTERRELVGDLARRAFARATQKQPAAGLRDEVIGTFDAAIADPDVADRLGRLQRAEHWSGFGFAAGGTPELTVVRGGRDEKAKPAPKPKVAPAERRKQQRALARAQEEFDAAQTAFDEAQSTERDLAQHVKRLAGRLAKLQSELDQARDSLEAARKEVTAARGRRRDARSALDRAERAAD